MREFLSQFELIAPANRWSVIKDDRVGFLFEEKGVRHSRIRVDNIDYLEYTELKDKLELRFGESYLSQTIYSQFTNRKQKFREDFATLGTEIEKLSHLAYPECTYAIRDKIACAQFVSVLSSGFVKRTLQLEGITLLRLAIERAKAIKLIQRKSHEKEGRNNRYFGGRFKERQREGREKGGRGARRKEKEQN